MTYAELKAVVDSVASKHPKLKKFILGLDKKLLKKSITEREAFYHLLMFCAENSSLCNLKYEHNPKIKPFIENMDDVLKDTVNQTRSGSDFDNEKMFLFLYVNAKNLLSEKIIRSIVKPFIGDDKGSISLQEINWKLALAVYQRQRESINKKTKTLCKQTLIGYLYKVPARLIAIKKYNDINSAVNKANNTVTVSDFIFYRMADKAPETIGIGPYENTFIEDLQNLSNGHTELDLIPDIENLWLDAPDKYDCEFLEKCDIFYKEVNQFYQTLEHDQEKKALKDFVKKLNKFDKETRLLQAERTWIVNNPKDMDNSINRSIGRPTQQGVARTKENGRIRKIKWSIAQRRTDLSQQAAELESEAATLFKGKPGSTGRKLLGMSLMVIGLGLIALGVVGLIFPPVGIVVKIAGVSTVIAADVILGGTTISAMLGTAGGLGGAMCFFKGCVQKPSKVIKATNGVIQFCKKQIGEPRARNQPSIEF